MKKKLLAGLAAGLFLFCVVGMANASLIVDTGTPNNSPDWFFSNAQYFGAEFNINDTYSINSIEGYFSNEWGGDSSVTIGIHSDDGNTPGTLLNSATFAINASAQLDWYGVNALNWTLISGTYWVSFVPGSNIDGKMPGTAPSPMGEYAKGGSNGWIDFGSDYFDHLGIGIRIDATTSPVPEPATMMLFGLGLLGLAGCSRRKI